MFQLIQDIHCNRCKEIYKSNERGVLSVLYDNCYFSICPKCTKEVAALMGFTEESLIKDMARMKVAETENNKKYDIERGDRCRVCEKKFKEGDVRVESYNYDNANKFHLDCYKLYNS